MDANKSAQMDHGLRADNGQIFLPGRRRVSAQFWFGARPGNS
jgi:hypothetical protein